MLQKICPYCQTVNPFTNRFCKNQDCGESLLQVKITESEQGNEHKDITNSKDDTPPELQIVGEYVKICPECQRVLPPIANRCECGRSLFDVQRVQRHDDRRFRDQSQPADDVQRYTLRSEDGFLEIPISEGADLMIGRSGIGAEYLQSKGYVSREHLRVRLRDGLVYVTHVASTNDTLLDGKAIDKNRPVLVPPHALLALGAHEGQTGEKRAAYLRLLKQE